MMYIHMTFSKKNHSTHSTELFKIFFSLLTLSTAFFCKKLVGREKIKLFVHLVTFALPSLVFMNILYLIFTVFIVHSVIHIFRAFNLS